MTGAIENRKSKNKKSIAINSRLSIFKAWRLVPILGRYLAKPFKTLGKIENKSDYVNFQFSIFEPVVLQSHFFRARFLIDWEIV